MVSHAPRSFVELIALQQTDTNTFTGRTPDSPWGRVYGGQVVAQSLAAAAVTVPADHFVHSLHAYFVLGGVPLEEISFEVDRLREGRSFTTRRVVARQTSGAILNLDASFQRIETDVEIQETNVPMDLPSPETLPETLWPGLGDVREIPNELGSARSQMWMRIGSDLGDDPVVHACALAYLSDHNPMDAIIGSHPASLRWDEMMTASLDHNVWFHRPVRADHWMLFDLQGHGLVNARGMATGSVHAHDGRHVATIAQEGLVRSPRL